MFKFNRTFFIVMNFIISTLTFMLFYMIRYKWTFFLYISQRDFDLSTFLLILLFSSFIIIFTIAFKMYEINKISRIKESLLFYFLISIFSIFSSTFIFYFFKIDFARFVFFTGFLTIPIALSIINKIIFIYLFPKNKPVKLLFVGNKKNHIAFSLLIEKYNKIFPIETNAFFMNDSYSSLINIIDKSDMIIVDSNCKFNREIANILHLHELRYRRIYTLIDLFEYLAEKIPVETIEKSTHFELFSSYKINSFYSLIGKNISDKIVALILITITFPIMLITAIAIKISSKGPVFFNQWRIGLGGKKFKMYKFRSMTYKKTKKGNGLTQINDSRLTVIGKFIRPLRIDELPQLFNVVKGEMSLIGPRPERQEIIDQILEKYPLFNKRLLVKPGLTGWAQVKYHYVNSITEMNDKLSFDLYYIKNISLFLDLKIVLYTFDTILFKRGAI